MNVWRVDRKIKAKTSKNSIKNVRKSVSRPPWQFLVLADFEGKLFFRMLLKNFLCVQWLYSRYLSCPLNIANYNGKRIGMIRHIYPKIFTKIGKTSAKKKTFLGQDCSWKSILGCFSRFRCPFTYQSLSLCSRAILMAGIGRIFTFSIEVKKPKFKFSSTLFPAKPS